MKRFWKNVLGATIALICCLPLMAFAQFSHMFTNTAHIDDGGVARWISVDANGTVFLSNNDEGLRAYTYGGSSFTNTAHIDPGGITKGVAFTADGTVILANGYSGLRALSYDGSSFTSTASIDLAEDATAVAVNADGTIFVVNSFAGLRAFNYDGLSFTSIAHIDNGGSASDVALGADGTIFTANRSDGLRAYSYDGVSFTNTAHINQGVAYSLAIGADGTIFVASGYSGLHAYSYDGSSFTNTAHMYNGRAADAVAVGADGTIFLASFRGGLYAYTYDGSSFTNTAHIGQGMDMTDVAVGADGTIFLANFHDGMSAYRYFEKNTYIVTNTNDAGSGSFRQAILDANAHPNIDPSTPDTIKFNIDGAGPHSIQPGSALPDITDAVIIDGTTNPDANHSAWPPTLSIELNGSNAGSASGLTLLSDASGSTIRGLVINGFDYNGIDLVYSSNNLIECNFIGTNTAGTAAIPNLESGILVNKSTRNTVGGTNAGAGNLISGNGDHGIFIVLSDLTLVQGNYIGTNAAGTEAIPNENIGILNDVANRNTIGGGSAVAGNLISGNGDRGILIRDSDSTLVQGNNIGMNAAGTEAIPNEESGMELIRSDRSTIGGSEEGDGNIIAYNNGAGLFLDSGLRNRILGNAIFNNGTLGIDIAAEGVNANDPGDDDIGANDLQNFPLLTTAKTDDGEITISGTFNSTANTNGFRLEFFASTSCNGDQSGNPQSEDYGEGETFLGYTTVNTDANGDARFTVNLSADVAVGAFISATATSPDSSTSEFSQCIAATPRFVLLSAIDIEISGLQLSDGDMHANDDITFNKGLPGTHTGNLSAVDNIDISSKNTIDGDVNAGGDLDNDGTINGAANGGASVDPVDLPTLASFTAGTENVTVDGDGDVTLPPGMNKDVVVERDGTLRLNAGEYFLDELEFGTDTRLIVDVSGGDVVVNIVSDLEFGQRMEVSVSGGSTSRFIINSIQTKNIDFGREATVIATIIAPDAKVRAGSYVRFSGSICAKDIVFSTGPVIVGHNASLPKVVVNDEADVAALPQVFVLEQNYPNPFNPTTNIGFRMSDVGFVQLAIYDITGQLVRTLVNEHRAAGNYTVSWDATNDFGAKVASGVYLYKLQAADFVQVKKMVLLK